MIRIGTVISYCTLDYKFINECVDAVKSFSKQIIISVADHFFDGTPEDRNLLTTLRSELDDVKIIEYAWHKNDPKYWHNMARWHGYQNLNSQINYVLFLDADEIIDTILFNNFIQMNNLFSQFDAFTFYCYWYFREAKFRAKTLERAGLLVKKDIVNRHNMFTFAERDGIFYSTQRAAIVNGNDGIPIVHHYSWVRTKEEMLRKVKCWAHKDDADWGRLIEEEFSHEFNGTDFLPGHHYQYDTIEPVYDIKI